MKAHNKIKELIILKKIYIYFLALLLIGVLLMLLSKREIGDIAHTSKQVTSADDHIEENKVPSKNDTEEKLEAILRKADGVGDIEIIINYSSTSKKVPLLENENKDSEKVVNSSEGSTTKPYIIAETSPEIEGVVIVAQGGGDENVISALRTAVSGYLGVPMHKINILKME